jgi:hypothetical protein
MLNNVKPGGVTFQRVIFAFHDAYAPLSWHLTSAQQAAIDENWKSYQTDKIKEIKAAFGCQ